MSITPAMAKGKKKVLSFRASLDQVLGNYPSLGPIANGNCNATACEMILRALADQSKGVVM